MTSWTSQRLNIPKIGRQWLYINCPSQYRLNLNAPATHGESINQIAREETLGIEYFWRHQRQGTLAVGGGCRQCDFGESS